MTMIPDLIGNRFAHARDSQMHLASWYTQGLSDGFGDRLLMFDNTSAPSWEILRFKPELLAVVDFEAALRERVEELAHFHHPAFSSVRVVDHLAHQDGVALVSTCVPGARLSDAFGRPRSAAFAFGMIRQLTAALAALQQQGRGIAHGALVTDRIVATPDGRLMIREHVLGSALQSLELSGARLWAEFGIVAPPPIVAAPTLDCRADVVQLALLAVSLMLGRHVTPGEYQHQLDRLLAELTATVGGNAQPAFPPLRHWLERALQLNDHAFESAQEAEDALGDLRGTSQHSNQAQGWVGSHARNGLDADAGGEHVAVEASPREDSSPLSASPSRALKTDAIESASQVEDDDRIAARRQITASLHELLNTDEGVLWQRRHAVPSTPLRGVTAVIGLLAIGEAALIGQLLHARPRSSPTADAAIVVESPQPGADVWVDGRPAGVTPIELKVNPRTRSIRVLSHDSPTRSDAKVRDLETISEGAPTTNLDNQQADVQRPATISQRSGGVRFLSPIQLQVLDGERPVGSTEVGPIVLTVGRHELKLVNSALGFRTRRVVDVKAGQIVSLAVTPPDGIVSINAMPWAEVWIDGKSVGETPLGNLSVPVGEHEIVFRHPQLGERRETAIVRSDAPTRVSANLRR